MHISGIYLNNDTPFFCGPGQKKIGCLFNPESPPRGRYFPPMVDVWSCGVILFALVCGFLPFEAGGFSPCSHRKNGGCHMGYLKIWVKRLVRS